MATLYGVETRAVNQAVKNDPNKFPRDYIFQLDGAEFESLKSNETESSTELNFVVAKLKHTVRKIRRAKG